MALQGGHRFAVSMEEVFPRGLYAVNVDQAMDFDEKTKARTPSRDKVSDSLVWTVACIEADPDARSKEVKIKVQAPYMPELPPELFEGSGLRPVVFEGLTVTPYIDEQRGRARLAFSFRATGLRPREFATGPTGAASGAVRAPAGSASGRSAGQASAA